MKKIALIIPRFQHNILDGAEILAKSLGIRLNKYYQLTILTTQAKNYLTWKNEVKNYHEIWQGIDILRFPVSFQRNFYRFNQISHQLYQEKNSNAAREEEWIKQHGPYSLELLDFIKKNCKNYDLFIFVGYLNAITFFALPTVKEKALLIPLAHKEPPLRLNVFERLFSKPRIIIANSRGEKELMIKRFSELPPIIVIGINSDTEINLKHMYKSKISKPYMLFIGRIELTKGINQLFDYFIHFKNKNVINFNLILVGKIIDPIPFRKDIKYLGIVSEKEKVGLIQNSEFLINSSYSESLSLTLMEAWKLNKAVLVNGACEVLKLQVIDSSGGLYYSNYQEFEKAINWLIEHKKERKMLGINGKKYVDKNYNWDTIEKKLKICINAILR